MTRPVVLDVSHLAHRLRYSSPSGIEKVDFAYGRHFGLQPGKIVAGAHYRITRPRVIGPAKVKSLVTKVQSKWAVDLDLKADAKFQAIRSWIVGGLLERPDLSDRDTRLKEFFANYVSRMRRDVW